MTYFDPGEPVVYQPHPEAVPEVGVVVRQTEHFVFVRFGDERGAKACYPADLARQKVTA